MQKENLACGDLSTRLTFYIFAPAQEVPGGVVAALSMRGGRTHYTGLVCTVRPAMFRFPVSSMFAFCLFDEDKEYRYHARDRVRCSDRDERD